MCTCMINCTVFDNSTKKTLLPWHICLVDEPGCTVEQHFHTKLVNEIQKRSEAEELSLRELTVESAYIGQQKKDSPNASELSLSVESAADE